MKLLNLPSSSATTEEFSLEREQPITEEEVDEEKLPGDWCKSIIHPILKRWYAKIRDAPRYYTRLTNINMTLGLGYPPNIWMVLVAQHCIKY